MQESEVVVEAYEECLREAHILCGYGYGEGKCAKDKYGHCDERAYDYGTWVVALGVVDIHHMNTHHLHTGVE